MGCAASRDSGPGSSLRSGRLALAPPQLCSWRGLLQLLDPSLFANGAPETHGGEAHWGPAHSGQAYHGHTNLAQGLPGAASSVLAAASLSTHLLRPQPKPCLSRALKTVNWIMAAVDGAISVIAAVQVCMHRHAAGSPQSTALGSHAAYQPDLVNAVFCIEDGTGT